MDNKINQSDIDEPINTKTMSQSDFNKLMVNVFARQRRLAGNSNFYIDGFNKHIYSTILQAFAEELGVINIKDT